MMAAAALPENFSGILGVFINQLKDILQVDLNIKLFLRDRTGEHPAVNSTVVLLAGEVTEGKKNSPGENVAPGDGECRRPEKSDIATRRLVGKSKELQHFLNKEGPSYDNEFLLDIEINLDSLLFTVNNINLPLALRNRGKGAKVADKLEELALLLGIASIYVPAEHRATSFWLKHGYVFNFEAEKNFYEKNRLRAGLYVAYDLRKPLRQK